MTQILHQHLGQFMLVEKRDHGNKQKNYFGFLEPPCDRVTGKLENSDVISYLCYLLSIIISISTITVQ